MPIRHCQKCGLKVLIDDSQSAINPFHCQRCTAALKGSGESDAPAPAAVGAGSGSRTGTAVRRAVAPAAASASSAGGKPATVKVLCPYCKASFNGRIPQKPARGACPVCQKELILLPTGDIRAAAGFDAMKWQAEQTAAGSSTKESGTKTLVKKYAAEQPATAATSDPGMGLLAPPQPEAVPEPEPVAPAPSPLADTAPADTDAGGGGGLPSWLDDEQPAAAPAAASAPVPEAQTEPVLDAVQAEAPSEPEPIPPAELPSWLDDASPAPKSAPAAAASDPGAYDPTIRVQPDEDEPAAKKTPPPPPRASKKPAAAAPPPPAPPAKSKTAAGRKGAAGRRTGRHTTAAPAGAKAATGLGTILLAYVLLATPLVACPILLGQKDKFAETPLDKLGARFQRGFAKIYDRWFNPPPAPKPIPPPSQPVEEEKAAVPTAEDKARDKQAINDAWTKYKRVDRTFKQRSVGATPAEKAAFKKAEEEVNALKAKYEAARKYYRDIYKEDYDPTQE